MAIYSFRQLAFSINLNGRERRALGRPNLVLEKSRLLSVEMAQFPTKESLGIKISKFSLFSGAMGEFRSNTKRTLVLGNLRGSAESLKIKVSHPSIDEIWVCGSGAKELEQQLAKFIKTA